MVKRISFAPGNFLQGVFFNKNFYFYEVKNLSQSAQLRYSSCSAACSHAIRRACTKKTIRNMRPHDVSLFEFNPSTCFIECCAIMIELSSTLSLVHQNEPGKKSHNMLNLLLLLLILWCSLNLLLLFLTAVFDEVNIEELFNRVCVPLVYRKGL